MKRFTRLIAELDQTTSTSRKTAALERYFREAPEADRVWTIALFTHRRPKRAVNTAQLRSWTAEMAGLPLWMVEECWHIAGDLSETLATLLPDAPQADDSGSAPETSLAACLDEMSTWKVQSPEYVRSFIENAWRELDREARFVFNKFITGGFRVGVSDKLLQQALAKVLERDTAEIALCLSGNWSPQSSTWESLFSAETQDDSRPYPFYLAYALEQDLQQLGNPADWQAEWKWDGIRGQLVARNGNVHVWSRGEELISDSFPELSRAPLFAGMNAVLDGEIIAWENDAPLPFQVLQSRLGRKRITAGILQKAPVIFLAYDLLEWNGEDYRPRSLAERRSTLEKLWQEYPGKEWKLSPALEFDNWNALLALKKNARQHLAEGLMLKKRDSPYQSGRKRGAWWKWKTDPFTVDAVMIYAQRGHGRRAGLYTDFTFAVYDSQRQLVPFAKAYSGLTDAEFEEINRWIKDHTRESFGPVRSVDAELVFELAFEGIGESKRHKSGVAVRFPRIVRWRKDKKVGEINTLEDLRALIRAAAP
jgi:DNA ligase-1